jgi:hypothetical protein
MKIKILSLILAFFSFSFNFKQNTALYSVSSFSKNQKIKINGKPVFVGQTFKSFKDVQFSNCQNEFLLAMPLHGFRGVYMKGKCKTANITPYISELAVKNKVNIDNNYQVTIVVGSFQDQINASTRVEEIIIKGFDASMEIGEKRTIIGIPFQYEELSQLDSMINLVRKSFKDAYVVKNK